MSRVEKLLEAAESPSLNFLKYTRCRVKANKLPIFVFEGVDDPKYYTPRMTYRFQQNWLALSVSGKRKVLELKDDVSANPAYANDAVCFFVDRDFDETLGLKNKLYVTPQYSIENLYVGSGTVRQFIVAACGLSTINDEDEEIVDYVLSIYNSSRQAYVSSKLIRRVNLAYLYIRNALGDKLISLDSLFTITHVPSANYGCQIVLKKKGQEVLANLDKSKFKKFVRECVAAKRILKGDVDYFRGKQELSFLREFLNSIRSEGQILHRLVHAQTGKLLKFKNTSVGNDILSDLSFAALTPVCLANFLDDAANHFEQL